MIIYGSRAKLVAKETLSDKCTYCNTQYSVEMNVFQRYAHVFWIPFFPVGKTGVSQCDHCKQVLKLKEMPPALQESYHQLKGQAKRYWWMYTGLGLIFVLIVVGAIGSKASREANTKMVLAPQAGDVYEIKKSYQHYTLYKVAAVKGDSVEVYMNEFGSTKLSGLYDIKRKGDAAYSVETLVFSKTALKEMLEKGELMDVERN